MRKINLLAAAGAAIIVAAPAAAAPAENADVAAASGAAGTTGDGDEIVVTGQKAIDEASSGTKSNTPLIETPQSISVVTNSDIAGLGLQNLNQAMRFVAGVTPETRGASAEVYDQFKLRGFDAPIFLDGLRLFSSSVGYAQPQVDVSRIDRIEVIKGPASALYGQSGPGGLVAEQSKLPLERDFYGAVAGTYGTFDLYRVDADIGGRISDDALWRLYGSVNGAHSQQRFGYRRRYTVSGAGTIGAGTPTTLTVLAAYSHDPRNGDYGVFPFLGTRLRNPNGPISQNFYGGEPDDFFGREQFGLTYIGKHDFGGGWTFRALGRYQYVSSRLGITYTGGYPLDAFSAAPNPAPTLYSRFNYSTREQGNSWTYDNQLAGILTTGPLRHEVLLGIDRQVSHQAATSAFGVATPIDVYNPVYGTIGTPRQPEQVQAPFALPGFLSVRLRQQGAYAQDQISLAGLRLTLSGRHDWARSKSATDEQHDTKFTYRIGGLYLFDFGLAPYASYSTSFQPQGGRVSDDGGVTLRNASPTIGKQVEAGLKYKVPGTEILLTGAWFRIEQTNVLTSIPPGLFSIESGKVRSRGVEFEATAPLPYDFNAKIAFSRQRVKRLGETVNGVATPSRGLDTVGRGGVSANLEWAPRSGTLEGVAIGGAVRHVDSTYAGVYLDGNDYRTRPYTLFDALARFELGRLDTRLTNMQLSVNATNIFDNKHLTSCFAAYGWCWYGNRRTVQGTLAFRW